MIPKLVKKSTDTTVFNVDYTEMLPANVTLSAINTIVVTGPTISAGGINSSATTIGNNLAAPNCSLHFTAAAGTNNTEYLITITTTLSDSTVLIIEVILLVTNAVLEVIAGVPRYLVNYYGAVNNHYFETRLNSDDWVNATSANKMSALVVATRHIDALDLIGCKTDSDQPLQFPRNGAEDTPDDIVFATYEEALVLLSGDTLEEETSSIGTESEGIGTAKVTYRKNFIQTNVRSGIISIEAWYLLLPYLRNNLELDIIRVN